MSDDLISPELEAAAIVAAQNAQKAETPAPVAPAPTEEPQQQQEATPPPQPDASIRARQQSQRLREAARSEAELAARARQEVETEKAAIARQKAELEEALSLIKKDPASFLKRHEIPVEDLIKAKWEENKDGYRLTQQEKAIKELNEKLAAKEAQEAQLREAQQVEANQVAFIKLAMDEEKYPHIKDWYDDAEDLLTAAYSLQGRFQRQFGRNPSQDEIAMNLDELVKERYARVKGRQEPGETEEETPPPAKLAQVTKKRSLPAATKTAPSAPIDRSKLSDEDLDRLATQAAQREIDLATKRNGAG